MSKLYLVGIGLSPDLITLRALEVIRNVKRVFIEAYTNVLVDNGDKLLNIIGKKDVTYVTRHQLEDEGGKVIIDELRRGDVALLVFGDPLVATTHASLIIEAHKKGFKVEVIPGISVVPNALTLSGLMVYKLGKIATVVYPKEGIIFEYPYDVIKDNDSRNLHTLLLLDLDVERGIYMKVPDAIRILLSIEEKRGEGIIRLDRLGIAIAALGSKDQVICPGTLSELLNFSVDKVPQTLIITSPKLHFVEEEMIKVVKSEFCKC